jgi:hypothetical protein
MSLLVVINALLAICGGILAASAFIVSKRPDAQRLVDRLVPYQTLIGVALIAVGLIDFFKSLKGLTDFFKVNLFSAASLLTMIAVSVLLGLLFGTPQILKWLGGSPPPPPSNNPYAQMYQQMQAQQGQPMGYPPPQQMGYPPSPQQNKLVELQQKIAPFQIMIGLLAILASLVVLLYQFKILHYSGANDPF